MLELVNLFGPGGRVIHRKEALQASEQATDKRSDRVWIHSPPLEAFRDILTVNTEGHGKGYVHRKTYQDPPLVDQGMAKAKPNDSGSCTRMASRRLIPGRRRRIDPSSFISNGAPE